MAPHCCRPAGWFTVARVPQRARVLRTHSQCFQHQLPLGRCPAVWFGSDAGPRAGAGPEARPRGRVPQGLPFLTPPALADTSDLAVTLGLPLSDPALASALLPNNPEPTRSRILVVPVQSRSLKRAAATRGDAEGWFQAWEEGGASCPLLTESGAPPTRLGCVQGAPLGQFPSGLHHACPDIAPLPSLETGVG